MSEYDEAIGRFLRKGGLMLQAQAAEHDAPKVTGRLGGDIHVLPQTKPNEISVGNSRLINYAVYVHYGTGLYGPKKQRITPKKAKALKTPYGYRKSTAGQKANPYLDNALEALVRSGRLNRLLSEFGDEMSEEVFDKISVGLKNIRVV